RLGAAPGFAGKRPWVLGLLAVAGLASNAAALTITGGPSLSPPGGGSCVVGGTPCQTGGATVTCTGLNPSAVRFLYYGVRADTFVQGDSETGTSGPASASNNVFRISGTTGSTITYTGTTSVTRNSIRPTVTRNVSTQMILAVTS